MRKLVLQSIKCNKTEDRFGSDECRFEIISDSAPKIVLKRSMNDGNTWKLNRSVTFEDSIIVNLWDEDNPGVDDFLGGKSLDKSLRSGGTVRFRRDGANYTLKYSVVDEPSVSPPAPSVQQIKRVMIELLDVYCLDTEDIVRGDEFYLQGAVVDDSDHDAVLTPPISIGKSQIKSFKAEGRILYDKPVNDNSIIRLVVGAFDEDFAKDWDKYDEYVKAIVVAISAGLAATTAPTLVATGTLLGIALTGFNLVAASDKDDELGRVSERIKVKDLQPGKTIGSWKFEGGTSSFSNWEYVVRYQITAEI